MGRYSEPRRHLGGFRCWVKSYPRYHGQFYSDRGSHLDASKSTPLTQAGGYRLDLTGVTSVSRRYEAFIGQRSEVDFPLWVNDSTRECRGLSMSGPRVLIDQMSSSCLLLYYVRMASLLGVSGAESPC